MAYNPDTDKTAGYISPFHKDLLQRLAETQKRSIRAGLENIIEHYTVQEFGYEYFRALKDAYEADRLAALQGPQEQDDTPASS